MSRELTLPLLCLASALFLLGAERGMEGLFLLCIPPAGIYLFSRSIRHLRRKLIREK